MKYFEERYTKLTIVSSVIASDVHTLLEFYVWH